MRSRIPWRAVLFVLSTSGLVAWTWAAGGQVVEGPGASGPAAPVADVETAASRPRGAAAHDFVEVGGVLYYAAEDVAHGQELWRSDGTEDGTYVVADILPGPVGSVPRHLTVVRGTLFFVAFDGQSGFGLWKSDGTGPGTVLVKGAGGDFLRPGQLTALGSTLLLTAGPLSRPRLWRSDGTPEGTEPVRELWEPGEAAGFALPRLPGALAGGHAWFMSRADGRRALWRTDGSAGGTSRVWVSDAPIPLSGSALHYDLYGAFGDLLLFRGQDAQGDGLWRSDGTAAGTYLLAQAGSHLAPDWFTPLGTTAFFLASGVLFAGHFELWRTDGTPAGTFRTLTFGAPVTQLTSARGRLFLAARDGALIATDGTPGDVQVFPLWADRPVLASNGQDVFFAGRGALGVMDRTARQPHTFRVDAELAGTGFEVFPSSANAVIAPLSGRTLFGFVGPRAFVRARRASGPLWSGGWTDVLWRSDGTTATTLPLLADAGHTRGSWPEGFAGDAQGVYFGTSITREQEGFGLVRFVRTDGTPGGTTTLASWEDCVGLGGLLLSCRLVDMTRAGTRMFFIRVGPFAYGGELWTSDGTAEGTHMIPLGFPPNLSACGLGAVGGRVVFCHWNDLWASDGTRAGTLMIAAGVAPSFDPPWSLEFTAIGGTLYFATPAGLWKTDGTPGSVQLVKALPVVAELTAAGDRLYFTSAGALWGSRGNAADTDLVADTRHASRLTAVGSRVFFTAWDAAHGMELWVSDGSAWGTGLVADLRAGPASSDPDGLAADGWRLFFTADDGLAGRELWVTDGTREGTLPLADIHPGSGSALAEGPILAAADGRVYFPAFTPATGLELWTSDGTPEGTALVQDIAPGPSSSNPRGLAVVGDRLYFGADDGVHGHEPWSLALPGGERAAAKARTAPGLWLSAGS